MFKKILLPVDLSDRHGQAVDVAADLAEQSGGEIVLLHVIEVIAGLSMEEEKHFYNRLDRAAKAHLEHLGGSLKQRKGAWRAELLYGNRVVEIVRHAREAGTDLIVLTSPRIDPEHPAIGWGSLSYKVSMLSPCPVLLVKTGG
jgi:nucleotide-binding universal stress UspA family protein